MLVPMRVRTPLRSLLRPSFGVLIVGALVVLAACGGSDGGKAATSSTRRRTTTTTGTPGATAPSSTTGSSTPSAPSTPSTVGPATPTTTAAPGTCGGQEGIIADAVNGSDQLAVHSGTFRVVRCRIAASQPIWAAADVVPDPGSGVVAQSVLLERLGSIWTVVTAGTGSIGCQAPAGVRAELMLPC